ncbi:MAG: hypothetical protein WBP16_06315, partial [Ferruginibacter sp.]
GNNIYNNNAGNVGIGTSSPTSKLHIAGDNMLINGANPILQFQQAGVNTSYIQASGDNLRMGTNSGNSAGKMVIRMNATDRVFIDSIGQMGIGRTTPTERLDVDGKIRITPYGISAGSDAELKLYANPSNAFNSLGPAHISFYNWQSIGGGNYAYNKKYKLEFEGGTSERLKMYHIDQPNQLVLDDDGEVGIGILPTEKLHVNGNMLLQNGNPLLKLKTTSILAAAETGIQFNGPSSNNANISYRNSALFLSGRDTTAAGNIIPDLVLKGDKIGVGTASPAEKLHIIGNMLMNNFDPIIQLQNNGTDKGFFQLVGNDVRIGANSSNTTGKFVVRTSAGDKFFVDNAGYVGLDVTGSNALARLHVASGNGVSLTTHGYLMLGNPTSSNTVFDNNEIMARGANGSTGFLILQRQGGGVRIGATIAPNGYKLAVDGKMICEEVKVKLASNWPDYVFDEKYRLQPLSDVEKFIQTNKHLPNIPSAAEVEKNGIELCDMQKRMMEKIEELTLYIIDLKKEIDVLKMNNEKKN